MYIQQLNTTHGHDLRWEIDLAGIYVMKIKAWRWLAAVLLQSYIGSEHAGKLFNWHFWLKFMGQTEFCGKQVKEYFSDSWKTIEAYDSLDEFSTHTGNLQSVKVIANEKIDFLYRFRLPLKYELYMRTVMDFCINAAAQKLIMYTVPVFLCVEEPLDFVKDCTALLFISKLDDTERVNAREHLIKLKARIYTEKVHAECADFETSDQDAESRESICERSDLFDPGPLKLNRQERKYVKEYTDAFATLILVGTLEQLGYKNDEEFAESPRKSPHTQYASL
jgi:hypothetical protein